MAENRRRGVFESVRGKLLPVLDDRLAFEELYMRAVTKEVIIRFDIQYEQTDDARD